MRRRDFLAASAASLATFGLPGRLARAASTDDRVFLFLFVEGGWDPAVALHPMFDVPGAWTEDGSGVGALGDMRWVESLSRPAVSEFFERWGSELALIHGMEVPSITHERCTRILWTGAGDALTPDWPTMLAGDPGQRALPHLVIDGPAFSGDQAERVVRLGSEGQLPLLLDGSITANTDRPKPRFSAETEAEIDALVAARSQARAAGDGAMADLAQSHHDSLQALSLLQEQTQAQGLSLGVGQPGCTRDYPTDLETLFTCFDAGLSRCGMLRHQGWCDQGWDTHQLHYRQSDNFQDLFEVLVALGELRESWPSVSDRLVVVVASEMGRHPMLNTWGGKDHWTYTSLMLWGDGIRPGLYGGLDAEGKGRKLALETGETSDNGVLLSPQHIGATLMALGGEDPGAVGDVFQGVML